MYEPPNLSLYQALALADQLSVHLPVNKASNEQYESVLGDLGDEDFSAVMKSDKKSK